MTATACMINSRFLDGMTIDEAKEEVARRLEARLLGNRPQAQAAGQLPAARLGHFAPALLGLPDPDHPLRGLRRRAGARQDLPVKLPDDVTFDQPGNPLDRHPTWKHVACPHCGGPAPARDRHVGHVRRFVLVLRALHRSPQRSRADRSCRRPNHWLPVDQYIGGVEHAILHLLYSRFFTRAMREVQPCSAATSRSPASSPRAWSCHETYRDADGTVALAGRSPRRGRTASGGAPSHVESGEPVEIGPIEKMSKSKRNTVDPDEIIATYGADTARWFMLSDSPPERDVIWTEAGVQGACKQSSGSGGSSAIDRRSRRRRARTRRRAFGEEATTHPPDRRMARSPRSRTRSSGCASIVCIATIYDLANKLGAAVGAIETAPMSPTICASPSRKPATCSSSVSRR